MHIDIRERIGEVLQQGHLMSLATRDETGLWVADVIYIYDDTLTLYWMSKENARHSQAILTYSQTAGTITVSNKSKEPNFGIQFEGLARKIDGARHDLAAKHHAKRSRPSPSYGEDILKAGESWYEVRPRLIRLIDESNFGYQAQTYTPL